MFKISNNLKCQGDQQYSMAAPKQLNFGALTGHIGAEDDKTQLAQPLAANDGDCRIIKFMD
jgi:hypothetical protein